MADDDTDKFYSDAARYWDKVPASVDGMLGGFSHISSTDIGASNKFLRPFIRGAQATFSTGRALDCGAGIGRITKLLLTTLYDHVDMVEVNQEFLNQARQYIGEERAVKVDQLFCCGLQKFSPQVGHYDLIWCQWVLGHLTDTDLVMFFKRCKDALTPDGFMVVKENVTSTDGQDFDEGDSSYTRPKHTLTQLILQSGLTIIKSEKQKNFPKDIYDVWMFALQ